MTQTSDGCGLETLRHPVDPDTPRGREGILNPAGDAERRPR